MSDFLDKMIADLKEGASRSEGFMRGGHVGVEVARERRGREEKLAVENSTLVGGLPVMGPGLAGLNAAAHDGSMGSGFLTSGGAGLGQVAGLLGGGALGGAAGYGLGKATGIDEDKAALIGALLGGAGGLVGGGMLGAAGGRALGGPSDKKAMFSMSNPAAAAKSLVPGKPAPAKPKATPPPIPAAAKAQSNKAWENSPFKAPPKAAAAFEAGMKAAAAHFGLTKEALLPLIGSLAGGALLRGGLGMAAKRFGGNAVGRAAQGTLNFANKGGWRGGAVDMAGSMAGGALGSQLQGQQG